MLDREGFVAEPLYDGQVDLKARREGYLYDESLRSPGDDAPPPQSVPDDERAAREGAGQGGDLLATPSAPPGELIEPTDDFDVLMLQFQKAERQEEDVERAGAEAALAGVPRASEGGDGGPESRDLGEALEV